MCILSWDFNSNFEDDSVAWFILFVWGQGGGAID